MGKNTITWAQTQVEIGHDRPVEIQTTTNRSNRWIQTGRRMKDRQVHRREKGQTRYTTEKIKLKGHGIESNGTDLKQNRTEQKRIETGE